MNRFTGRLTCWITYFCLLGCYANAASATQATAGSNAPATTAGSGSAPAAPAKTASGKPSSSDIAAAKASGKVWVNTESGVYHKSGRWYGKTKQGKFMTEAEAKSAGYKAAAKE
ncbi:MAG: hypothetical protein WBV36_13170 [Terriglobales bacterium]